MSKFSRPVTRKEFFQLAAGLIGVSSLAACAGDDGDGSDDSAGDVCLADGNDELGTSIQSNHGHSISIPFADVEAGKTKSYTLAGPHEHTLEIDALVFEKLMKDGSTTVASATAGGHSHIVELSC